MKEDESDDEMEMSLDDFTYLRQVDRRGYLMKRSRKNHKVWHKRYCVLSDKLWIINVRSEKPRAVRVDLSEPGKVHIVDDVLRGSGGKQSDNSERIYEFVLDNGIGGGAYHFRAASSKELSAWFDDLSYRLITGIDDRVIQMGELIMSEEARTRSERLKSSHSKALHSRVGKSVMEFTRQSIYTTNSVVINQKKTVQEQLSVNEVNSQVSNASGKFAVFNGTSLPNDIDRLELLNNTNQGEEGTLGSNRMGLGGMFRRRSGSGNNLSYDRSFASSDAARLSSNNGKASIKGVLSREASSGNLKSLETSSLSATSSGLQGRGSSNIRDSSSDYGEITSLDKVWGGQNSTEYLCRYYLEVGIEERDSISEATTVDEDTLRIGAEQSVDGAISPPLAQDKVSTVTASTYIQAWDVDAARIIGCSVDSDRQSVYQNRPHYQKSDLSPLFYQPDSKEDMASNFGVAVSILHAVHNFKEVQRKTSQAGPSSVRMTRVEWQVAAALFLEFLSPILVVPESNMGVEDPRKVVQDIQTFRNSFKLSSSCVGKIAVIVTEAVEWCVTDISGLEQDGDANARVDADAGEGQMLNYREVEGIEVVQKRASVVGNTRSSSQSGTGTFWGAVFGMSSAGATRSISDKGGANGSGQGDDRGNNKGDRGHGKFFLAFPSAGTALVNSDSHCSLWAYLCTRKGAEVYYRQRAIACRVRSGAVAPPADLFDELVREVEAALNEGDSKL